MEILKSLNTNKKSRVIVVLFSILILCWVIYINKGNILKGLCLYPSDVNKKSNKDYKRGNDKIDDEDLPLDNGIKIAIDPGHGGRDPGKVGLNGALEKEINLAISLKLKEILESNGYSVLMTREDDTSLSSEGDSNKQGADLRNRVEMINNSNARLAISIHQNSFSQESCKGAQVFYYGTSKDSEKFAHIMQEQIKNSLQDGNKRIAKADTSYYLLKNTKGTIIIVECGFLSNNQEANLLTDANYQKEMAEAIYLGVETYMREFNKD